MTRTTKATSKTITANNTPPAYVHVPGSPVTDEMAMDALVMLEESSGMPVLMVADWQAQRGLKDRPASLVLGCSHSALANIRNAAKLAREAFPTASGNTLVKITGILYGAINSHENNRLTVAKHSFVIEFVAADQARGSLADKARRVRRALPETVKAKAPTAPTVDHSPKDGDSTETADDKGNPLVSNRETKQVATIADHIGIVSRWLSNPATSQAELSLHGAILDSLALVMMERDILSS